MPRLNNPVLEGYMERLAKLRPQIVHCTTTPLSADYQQYANIAEMQQENYYADLQTAGVPQSKRTRHP